MKADELDSLIVDDLERGLFRVHRSTMTSQAIYDLERERIFDRCWLYVGHESEIPNPGDFVRRDVGGRPIIFVRGADGEVRALFNSCTHRGATICRQDSGNARIFQCFYHAWTFDTKGDLVQVPDEAGYSEWFDRADRALRAPARFDNYRGLYFLNYDPEAEELADYLGDATDYIDIILFDPCPEGFRVLPGHESLRNEGELEAPERELDGRVSRRAAPLDVPGLHQELRRGWARSRPTRGSTPLTSATATTGSSIRHPSPGLSPSGIRCSERRRARTSQRSSRRSSNVWGRSVRLASARTVSTS